MFLTTGTQRVLGRFQEEAKKPQPHEGVFSFEKLKFVSFGVLEITGRATCSVFLFKKALVRNVVARELGDILVGFGGLSESKCGGLLVDQFPHGCHCFPRRPVHPPVH